MKRYIFSGKLDEINKKNIDVVIVGSGAAGLYTAISLDPAINCVVLNKIGAQNSNSMYAQGGIATVIEPYRNNDNPKKHFEDTLVAGAGLCDEAAVKVLVEEAWDNIEQLINLGVPFDKNAGELLLTREGGHSENRILHSGGDATGFHLTQSLYEIALKRPNIKILDNMFLSDIFTDENGVTGVLAIDHDNNPICFSSSHVIIAAGGIGHIYRVSTNATCATGDGIAAAFRAGAELKDMEFVQFHPTGFIHPNEEGRYFLISEALRGEGAILRNEKGEPFMQGVHKLADLAPRDIVARAIVREMEKENISNVYLDITSSRRSFLEKRFPTIFSECLKHNIDISQDFIPVKPVQHYFMGGIKTDTNGLTNVAGLYACGESACTGIHGANRLASNSLLECLVFGRRCAQFISGAMLDSPKLNIDLSNTKLNKDLDFDAYSDEIRDIMTKKCGIIRNGEDLSQAKERISAIHDSLDEIKLDTKKGMETYNQSQVALEILNASIKRKKSVGAHYRSDDKSVGDNKNA